MPYALKLNPRPLLDIRHCMLEGFAAGVGVPQRAHMRCRPARVHPSPARARKSRRSRARERGYSIPVGTGRRTALLLVMGKGGRRGGGAGIAARLLSKFVGVIAGQCAGGGGKATQGPARTAAPAPAPAEGVSTEALFFPCPSPHEGAIERLHAALAEATKSLDVCVFAFTDGRLCGALKAAHRRGVRVRVLVDDDQRSASGSKAAELAAAGVEVRDDSKSSFKMGGGRHADTAHLTSHMHNKFAVVDGGRLLLTGSFNWTTSAVLSNYENVLVLRDSNPSTKSAGAAYQTQFNLLWDRLA